VSAVLEVESLQFAYGKNKVLKGIDFSVGSGEALCVFGPNGCGKSTMLDCVLGLNKPESGKITIEGKDSDKIKVKELAQKIAVVPQRHHHTFGYTVFQMVLMGRTAGTGFFQSPGEEDEEIARKCLSQVGMLGFQHRAFNSLSGGEAQLVKLARALAQQTKLILFDEPTSHLDFRHELNVIKYMAALVRDQGISLVMSTHFPNHALYLENQGVPTKVAMMENGVFYAVGKASEVLNEENMSRIFKIKTKVYRNSDDGQLITYIMPVDFSDGGQWSQVESSAPVQ
jgi:iron complex transport system ATP-binding protein